MPFGQVINLPPKVSVFLPESLQLDLGLRGRVAGLETQPGDDALFSTFGCHGYLVGVEEATQTSIEKKTFHRLMCFINSSDLECNLSKIIWIIYKQSEEEVQPINETQNKWRDTNMLLNEFKYYTVFKVL